MSFRWSEDTTTKFVEHYLKHECLWNIKSVAYKNKQIKNSAYEDLEKTMNISGFKEKEIKSKIKNLRSTYSQELKKIKDSKKSGAGTDTIYVPTIKWFKIMDESLRNINSILTESESNLPNENSADIDTDNNMDAEENISEGNNSSILVLIAWNCPKPKSKPMAKKKRLSQLTSMVSQLKEITETVNTKSTEEENEFEVFGKHVGLQLKPMPLIVALEAQEHIQLYINQFRTSSSIHICFLRHKRSTMTSRKLASRNLTEAELEKIINDLRFLDSDDESDAGENKFIASDHDSESEASSYGLEDDEDHNADPTNYCSGSAREEEPDASNKDLKGYLKCHEHAILDQTTLLLDEEIV
ncbi:hypothetical protein FQA39_LY12588 [Lamprigera yunnana]|nr:hypothetical protein FQA39_LY12588 [Lamprigera yunnana]